MAISLKAARVQAGLTQSEIANLLKVSSVTYSHWETGKTRMSAEDFVNFAKVVGISLDNLFLPTTKD